MHKKGGYEAHMTFPKDYGSDVKRLTEDYYQAAGWIFSVITGCPLLGSGTYCYLTGYSKDDPSELRSTMEEITRIAESHSIPVLRSKIEHIVYDTKTGVNEL